MIFSFVIVCSRIAVSFGKLHVAYSPRYSLPLGSAEIIRGPLSISNAIIGGNARFECILSDESVTPWWNINGNDIDVAHLPAQLMYVSNSTTKVLIIKHIWQELNNSCIYCYLKLNDGHRVESPTDPAKLIIRPPTPSYSTSWQKTFTPSVESISATVLTRIPITTNSKGDSSHRNPICKFSLLLLDK